MYSDTLTPAVFRRHLQEACECVAARVVPALPKAVDCTGSAPATLFRKHCSHKPGSCSCCGLALQSTGQREWQLRWLIATLLVSL